MRQTLKLSQIGQALRIALEHGMHTNMQSQHVAEALAQRCRKIWWTVYVLDRNLSSLMGVPSSIRDEDISASLPLYPESPCRATALDIQVKLSRVIARISNGKSDCHHICPCEADYNPKIYTAPKDISTCAMFPTQGKHFWTLRA